MKKVLLLTVVKGALSNAGPKAPLDICRILEKNEEIESVEFASIQGMDYSLFLSLLQVVKKAVEEKRTVMVQYPLQPFYYHEFQELYAQLFSLLDPEKTILFVHDINHIRFRDMNCYLQEMQWLKPFHKMVVHNSRMKHYLENYLSFEYCIENEIFDYLCRNEFAYHEPLLTEEPIIVFAGNLAASKAPFLYELEEEKMRFSMNVYGRREGLIKNRKINYCGSFKADILPEKLKGGLGLIWDGLLASTEDSSSQKDYTRYNAPHKFSCYMSAGLPVIAWKEAAIGEVIKKYQVGYLIENLYDINDLKLEHYADYMNNARALGDKIKSGYFMDRVYKEIQERENVFF